MNNLRSLLAVWCSQLWEFLPFLSCGILGALFICLLITLCLLLAGSLLKSDRFPAWPQVTPRAATCTAVLPQIRQTFTLFMVFTELLLTQRGVKSHSASLKEIWNHAKTNPHMCWHPALPNQSSTFGLLPVRGNSCFQSYSSKHSDLLTFLLLFLCKIQPPFIKYACLRMYIPVLETRSIYAMLLLLTICTL